MLNKIILCFVIIGALNWGLIGLLDVDLVATLFGSMSLVSRILYTVIGLAGIYSISLLFKKITSSID